MRLLVRMLRNPKGFSFMEALISASIISILALGVGAMTQMGSKSSQHLKITRIAMTERAHITAALANPMAWQQTVAHNSSFACLATTTGCNPSSSATGYYDFILYDAQGSQKLTYDPSDSTTRPFMNGGACPATTADPSSDCPLKFKAHWRPKCNTPPCVNGSVEIKVDLETDFSSSDLTINTKNYEFSTIRGMNEDTIQSACLLMNGVFNSLTRKCQAKHASKTCANQGHPYGIVSGVTSNGNIICTPLYSGSCSGTQVMTGVTTAGQASCASRAATCSPVNCVGTWSSCSALCGGGTQSYTVLQAAKYGGISCPHATGDTQACNPAPCTPPTTIVTPTTLVSATVVNCAGHWSSCTAPCGGGTQFFTVTQAAAGGGAACPAADGAVQACNVGLCPPPITTPVDCAGYWGACDSSTGQQDFIVTQSEMNGGASCPASPQSCAVDCSGSWGACSGGVKTYSIFQNAMNGGAACPASNGQTDTTGCTASGPVVDCIGSWSACSQACGGGTQVFTVSQAASGGGLSCASSNGDVQTCGMAPCPPVATPVDCGGYWDACNSGTGQQNFIVTQAPLNGGAACPASPQACAVNCAGSWGACSGGVKTFSVSQPALNGGSACSYSNGATDSAGCAPTTGSWSYMGGGYGCTTSSVAAAYPSEGATCNPSVDHFSACSFYDDSLGNVCFPSGYELALGTCQCQ